MFEYWMISSWMSAVGCGFCALDETDSSGSPDMLEHFSVGTKLIN
jgi:hypothetical protein